MAWLLIDSHFSVDEIVVAGKENTGHQCLDNLSVVEVISISLKSQLALVLLFYRGYFTK